MLRHQQLYGKSVGFSLLWTKLFIV